MFGPRGTGKTTLIRNTLGNAFVIDLLEIRIYREYLKNPSILAEQKLKPVVVIDEVQKLPEILDEVHRLIETRKLTFLLTGSSARKLKRGGANLLAGRGKIMAGSELFGKAFAHFIVLEVRAFLSYSRKNVKMCYWRSTSQFEVELVLDTKWAIEIKSTTMLQNKHLKGIRALKEENNIENFAVVSCDTNERVTKDNITIFPWKGFLQKLWQGQIIL